MVSWNRIRLNNQIFSNLHWLAVLDLAENGIQGLSSGIFAQLQNLLELDLSGNLLSELPPEAFFGLTSLKKLNLDHNNLMFLGRDTLSEVPDLLHLIITNNPDLEMRQDTFDGVQMLNILNSDQYKFCCVAKRVETCTPVGDEFSSCEDLMANPALQVAIWVLGGAALAGNLFVVTWRLVTDRRKVSSFLLINLGMSDWLMGVYMFIIASVDVHYRGTYIIYADSWRASSLCQLAGVLAMLSSEVSVFMLTVITLDRLVNILVPLKAKAFSLKKAMMVVAGVWIVCLVITLLPVSKASYFGDAFFGRTGKYLFSVCG